MKSFRQQYHLLKYAILYSTTVHSMTLNVFTHSAQYRIETNTVHYK